MTVPVGVLIGSAVPPEQVARLAAEAEDLGFSELWYAEHYFHSAGLAGAATALAATASIPVGIGVLSAVARLHAVLAMELATLGRMHPGRIRAGIGTGEPARLADMGIAPPPRLGALRSCIEETRALVAGQRVGAVELAFPVTEPMPFYVGATGPKMLRLSGAIADGTVLSFVKSPAYISWAREQVEAGAAEAGRTAHHRIVSLAVLAVDDDPERARAAVRPLIAGDLSHGPSVFTDAHGISEQVSGLLDRGGRALLEREFPDEWIDDLAVAGDPGHCAAAITRQLEAGADAVALLPVPVARASALLRVVARDVLPLIPSSATPQGD